MGKWGSTASNVIGVILLIIPFKKKKKKNKGTYIRRVETRDGTFCETKISVRRRELVCLPLWMVFNYYTTSRLPIVSRNSAMTWDFVRNKRDFLIYLFWYVPIRWMSKLISVIIFFSKCPILPWFFLPNSFQPPSKLTFKQCQKKKKFIVSLQDHQGLARKESLAMDFLPIWWLLAHVLEHELLHWKRVPASDRTFEVSCVVVEFLDENDITIHFHPWMGEKL